MSGYVRAGYVSAGALKDMTERDIKTLNVINIAFGGCVDSKVRFEKSRAADIERIRAVNPDIRVLLSIGGWGAGGFSPMASTALNREKFAASALEIMKIEGLDGIDIDWEYPCSGSAGIEYSPDDKYNYTFLMQALREALDSERAPYGGRPMVTTAVGAGQYYIDGTEMDKVGAICDYISLMTYDMRGSWAKITGHHTNLLKPENGADDPASVEYTVDIFEKAGVKREKLVVGAAFYSRKWENVRDQNNGYLQPSGGTGGYGPSYAQLAAEYINKNGYARHWDDIAKAPYLFNGSTFISYDDAQSIAEKCIFIRENRLLGIMYWEHSCDPSGELLGVIGKELA